MILQILAAAASAASPQLVFPLACEIGRTCEIQHYVDRDPATGAVKDYHCGPRTNDGHDGTDIRLTDMALQRAGVNVLAAADGQVKAVRDGVADISIRAPNAPSIAGVQCGNRVAIQHAGEWLTDYCHMAKGSVTLKVGDQVKAGDVIGRVGLSGDTEFPHLHFSVRQGAIAIDPFAPAAGSAPACGAGPSLWRPAAAAALAYKERTLLNAGFAAAPLTMQSVEEVSYPKVGADAPAILAFVRATGLRAGDVQEIAITGPGGLARTNTAPPLARNQAQNLLFTGLTRPPQGWPRGAYQATYTVKSQGRVVLTQRFTLNR
jgi:murein DD-endopeptidase MepM/ murein hydrolase activator NlpD